MRHIRVFWAVVTVVVCGAAFAVSTVASGAQSPAAHHRAATDRIVVRPVSWSGQVSPGYTVSTEQNSSIDCTFPSPSPAAVDRDILFCSPDVEYAVACWLSRTPHRTLCLRDARKQQLVSIHRNGAMAQAFPFKVRAPLEVVLGNGTLCTFRAGGAGSSLQGHPNWAVSYYCRNNSAIWTPMNAKNYGIDRSHALWTARTAPSNGHGPLTTRSVTRAWFVGMHP